MDCPAVVMKCRHQPKGTSTHVDCTVVIPTRGRCPEPPSRLHYNPLCQCLDSLLVQQSLPKQIIVVSAVMPDYTAASLKTYERRFSDKGVDFTILWLPDAPGLGPFGKIAKTLDAISSPLVHLVEDDVFLYREAIGSAHDVTLSLQEHCPNLALVHLPLYRRATHPTKFLSYHEIGQCDATLRLTGCFESVFPRELLDVEPPPEPYPKVGEILAHPVHFFRGGNNIITKQALQVLRQITLGTPYGWEVCAGLHLTKQGFVLMATPYVNLAGMHSFYGANWGSHELLGEDWTDNLPGYDGLSLAEIVKNALVGKEGTGLGPLNLYVYYFRVATCYALILQEYARDLYGPWLRKIRSSFVDQHASDLTEGRQQLRNRAEGEAVYLASMEAITAGIAWMPGDEVVARVEELLSLGNDVRGRMLAETLATSLR